MRRRWTLVLTVAVAAAACSDTTATNTLLSDDEVTADLAASSGDAIAAALESMLGNEAAGALPMVVSPDGPVGLAVTHERSRTCLDAGGNVVPNCSPMSSVRKVATQVAIHGTRSGTRTGRDGGTVDWSGAVHRVMVDTQPFRRGHRQRYDDVQRRPRHPYGSGDRAGLGHRGHLEPAALLQPVAGVRLDSSEHQREADAYSRRPYRKPDDDSSRPGDVSGRRTGERRAPDQRQDLLAEPRHQTREQLPVGRTGLVRSPVAAARSRRGTLV
jgi:hypothetical protein